MSEFEIMVATEREYREVVGMDTVIALMPMQFYVEIRGQETLALQVFGRWLRRFSEGQAMQEVTGVELHHAVYVITSDPAVVRSRGAMHDCDQCREGVHRALNILHHSPQTRLLVGWLYWTKP